MTLSSFKHLIHTTSLNTEYQMSSGSWKISCLVPMMGDLVVVGLHEL